MAINEFSLFARAGMYTMPVLQTPELATVKRLTREYYPKEADNDAVYRALIDTPNRTNLRNALESVVALNLATKLKFALPYL